jgi:hypothetical protein
MAPDKQAEFIAKWFTKAEQDGDVFDRFISSWVGRGSLFAENQWLSIVKGLLG